MLEFNGNVWDFIGAVDAICIPTNGFIKGDGTSVMGAGLALQAKKKFPTIHRELTRHIMSSGNTVTILHEVGGTHIVSFPTKVAEMKDPPKNMILPNRRFLYRDGDTVPGFHLKSFLSLIVSSAKDLVSMADYMGFESGVVLPKVGCGEGTGCLEWDQVSRELRKLLDDRFIIVDFK
jgi:hypothetical protein